MSTPAPRAYTTYFDRRYLPLAVVMLRSIRRWDPDAVIFALCFDRTSLDTVANLNDPSTFAVSPDEALAFEPRLSACASRPPDPRLAVLRDLATRLSN